MTKDEWNEVASQLVRSLQGQAEERASIQMLVERASSRSEPATAAASEIVSPRSGETAAPRRQTGVPPALTPRQPRAEVERIAQSAAQTELATQQRQPSPAPKTTQATSQTSGSSTAAEVLKTVGLLTGVGPIVTGLLKLFGGSDEKQTPAPLVQYSLPSSLSVAGGLTQDRSIVPVSYSQSGAVRPALNAETRERAQSAPQIQINVNAMDSRSFVDHSDDIARAVKTAMLRSHSLNDVVSEI